MKQVRMYSIHSIYRLPYITDCIRDLEYNNEKDSNSHTIIIRQRSSNEDFDFTWWPSGATYMNMLRKRKKLRTLFKTTRPCLKSTYVHYSSIPDEREDLPMLRTRQITLPATTNPTVHHLCCDRKSIFLTPFFSQAPNVISQFRQAYLGN